MLHLYDTASGFGTSSESSSLAVANSGVRWYGTTPNKAAALGENVILPANLAWGDGPDGVWDGRHDRENGRARYDDRPRTVLCSDVRDPRKGDR